MEPGLGSEDRDDLLLHRPLQAILKACLVQSGQPGRHGSGLKRIGEAMVGGAWRAFLDNFALGAQIGTFPGIQGRLP